MEELLTNEEVVAKIENAKDIKEVCTILADNGIEISEEKLQAELDKELSGDLDETVLDQVTGGVFKYGVIILKILKSGLIIC